MRKVLGLSLVLSVGGMFAFVACSSSPNNTGFGDGGGGQGDSGQGHDTGSSHSDTGITPTGDGGHLMSSDTGGGSNPDATDGKIVTVTTTIYAHTDTELYSVDPMTKAVTDLGTFQGTSGGYYDSTITDLAVNAAGDIYVNSETVVYTVTLPATPGPGAAVKLTSVVNTAPGLKDGGEPTTRFYALAFAPVGALDSTEVLIGGDSKGNLWAIPMSGTPFEIGNFGTDPDIAANYLGLSGDLVFYDNASNVATGLATIRSCVTSSGKCTETNDYLAGVDMANLKANYTAKVSTASLLGGIYGGTASTDGNGTMHGEIFGLGAWQGDVYGFSRCIHCYDGGSSPVPAQLLLIDTTTGAASVVPDTFSFTDGWSGAGVTTKVTVTVVNPPPTMPPK